MFVIREKNIEHNNCLITEQKRFQIKIVNPVCETGPHSSILYYSSFFFYVTSLSPIAEKFPEARQTLISLNLRFPALEDEYQ